jgi:hypothetical protein
MDFGIFNDLTDQITRSLLKFQGTKEGEPVSLKLQHADVKTPETTKRLPRYGIPNTA